MTVVWSRPPKVCPIFGSDMSVSSRQRYIAICRAVASAFVLPGPQRSSIVTSKNSDVTLMMVGAVISGACESGMRSRSTISASPTSTACWFSEANAVARLDRDLAIVAQRVDEVVGELFGRDVPDAHAGEEPLRVMADRVQQVCLAEPGLTPDEERVVRARRCFGHSDRGRVREPVGRADDEGVERVLLVELRLGGLWLRGRGVGLA